MAKLDLTTMTPAEIRQNYVALMREQAGLPAEPANGAADLRNDPRRQREIIYVYLRGEAPPDDEEEEPPA